MRRCLQKWHSLGITAVLLVTAAPAHALLFEAGTTNLPDTSPNTFKSVTFRQHYATAPVVFALPTNEGGDPCATRIRSVTSSGFEIAQLEPSNLDGNHAAMNNVAYLAVEQGRAELAPGVVMEAGTLSTSQTVQHSPPFGSAGGHVTQNFTSPFAAAPAVLADIQTMNSESNTVPGSPSVPWMTTSVKDITATGFDVALERAEVHDGGTVVAETIGYLGITRSTGSFQANTGASLPFDAFLSPDAIDGWDDGQGADVAFNRTFGSAPVALASMAKRDGADGGWLRRGNITGDTIRLIVDEDTFSDGERGHTTEAASVVAFARPFDASTDPDTPFIHYTFESSVGGVVPDVSGLTPTYNGTLGDNAVITSGGQGIVGEALSLDGDNDFLSAGDVDELDRARTFSVSLWFNRDAAVGSATNHGVDNVLIAQSSSATNDNLEIGTQGGDVELYIDSGGGGQDATRSFAAGIADDSWFHLVLTYDGDASDEAKLYINGGLVTANNQWGGILDDSETSPLAFGLARPGDNDWGDFLGLIDEVQIYRRVLRPQEIGFMASRPEVTAAAYPEPGTLTLTALGLLGLLRRRKRQA